MDPVVHFEIPADDLERAKNFYSDVFGWKIQQAPMPGPAYHLIQTAETDDRGMLQKPGAINGGMMQRETPSQQPLIMIRVASIDAALEKAKNAGAAVVALPRKVGEIGMYAHIVDTEGNTIALWQDLRQE